MTCVKADAFNVSFYVNDFWLCQRKAAIGYACLNAFAHNCVINEADDRVINCAFVNLDSFSMAKHVE